MNNNAGCKQIIIDAISGAIGQLVGALLFVAIALFVFLAFRFDLFDPRQNFTETPPNSVTPTAETTSNLPTPISDFSGRNLVIWADSRYYSALFELKESIKSQYDINLEVVDIDDMRNQVLTQAATGDAPDIFIAAHDWLGQLVADEIVAPIDLGAKATNFIPQTLSTFQYNSIQYGMPISYENVALVRNIDLIPEAPRTWQEVREIGERFQEENGPYVFAIQAGDAYHHYPILTAFGGYVFGRNTDGSTNRLDIGFANQGGLAAAQWLSDMYSDDLMPANISYDEIFSLFEEGQLAMFITGPWFSQRITDTGINYSIDRLPSIEGAIEQGVPYSGVQGFMISAYSENHQLAEWFLKEFTTTLNVQQSLFDQSHLAPAFIGVSTSSDVNIRRFIEAGHLAVPMPDIPEMGTIWTIEGEAYTLISQGEDPIEVFTNAQEEMERAIANRD
jgi:arabinogalactan oligomer/maltooligosaccharide transport system substrate-binding protein